MKMKNVLILIAICVHKGLGITAPSSPQDLMQTLIMPCQNFIQQRISNPAISPMVVEYAKQQNDISKMVQYAEIDIVYISCMQLVGDYNDIQNLSTNQSGGMNSMNSAGGTASGSLATQSASSSPSLNSPLVSQSQTQPGSLPPVSPTSTVS